MARLTSRHSVLAKLLQGMLSPGRLLVEELRPISILHARYIDVIYSEVLTKEAVIYQLVSLEQEAEKGDWPSHHIECHGLENVPRQTLLQQGQKEEKEGYRKLQRMIRECRWLRK